MLLGTEPDMDSCPELEVVAIATVDPLTRVSIGSDRELENDEEVEKDLREVFERPVTWGHTEM